jgi:hypothetical protein
MIRRISRAAILVLVLFPVVAHVAASDTKTNEKSAIEAKAKEKAGIAVAEKWLALLDSGKYSDAWSTTSAVMKSAVSQELFVQQLAPVRKPLGKLISRSVKSSSYTTSIRGGPAGEYVVIHFNSAFENQKGSIETVTPMLEKDGVWRIAGYFIK